MSLRLDRQIESTATSEEAGVFAGTVSLFSVLSTAEKAQQDTIPESADTKGHVEHSYMDSESVIVDITAAVNKLKSREQWDPAKPGYLHFSSWPRCSTANRPVQFSTDP